MRHVRTLFLGWVICTAGCGPVAYTYQIVSAQSAVEEARLVGAPQRAPYEYYYAVEHIEKAREFASQAEYQNAYSMADQAEEYGNRARDLARRRQHESGR